MSFNKLLSLLLAQGILPDGLLRLGIKYRLAGTLKPFYEESVAGRQELVMKHVQGLKESPIAVATQEANQQHYELPAAFFSLVLGSQLKYSSGYWKSLQGEGEVETLDQAEEQMLALTAQRAQLHDGENILELGCGWGSLTLWMARHYPNASIVAISNSHSQRRYIESRLAAEKLTNVTVRTINMVEYEGEAEGYFNRVVSVEMLEHMKNYPKIFKRIASWLQPGGTFFAHIFTHLQYPYHYQIGKGEDWLARYFFTGGQMPSNDLFLYFQEDLKIQEHWSLSGLHYHKTAEAWLARMDAAKEKILPILAETYGENQQERWWNYWRIFFMACSELWRYRNGNEWMVSHYLFMNPS